MSLFSNEMIDFINNVDSDVISESAKKACIEKGIFSRAIVIASSVYGNENEVDTKLSMLSPKNTVEYLFKSGNQLDFKNNVFILKKSFL